MARKRPAVQDRPRDARVYRRLAAWARCHGYRAVTRHTVHHWVSASLLPKADSKPTGFGQRATTLHVATGQQLLALCRYRYSDGLGRYDLVGAQLWLDNFDVPDRFLRAAIVREFATPASTPNDIALSYQVARQRPIIDAMPNLSYDDRADVVDELRGQLEEGEPPSRRGIELIARAAGLSIPETTRALRALPTVPREAAAEAALATMEDLAAARIAWSSLMADITPDIHKNGRTRARVRLGLFVSACSLDKHLR
jgi:hypothetical protein